MRLLIIATAAALVAGCGGSGNEAAPADKAAAALEPGEYELAWSDVERKDDAKAPAASAGQPAAVFPAKACVAAGGALEPAAFAETGDNCHVVNSYLRNGRINVQLGCDREGKGKVSQIASGSFKSDSFEAKVETQTEFEGDGNYTMTRTVAGKRVGACTPAKES